MVGQLQKYALSILSPTGKRARVMIFTYHRVLDKADALLPNEPTAELFRLQLEWINKQCNVLSLSTAVDLLQKDKLPPRAACITFDDGYANNLEVAAPILKEFQIPATIFIAVDAVVRGIMWNDLIIEAVRSCGTEMELTRLALPGMDLSSTAPQAGVDTLLGHLKYLPLNERMELASAIFERATTQHPPRLMLREEELPVLQDFNIEIGAHTVNHPILTRLSEDDARREIENSRDWITRIVGKPPKLFAYPNGRYGDDYDERHAKLVKEAGFLAAVSTNWGVADRSSPRFELPRFMPWETTAIGFSNRLVKSVAKSYAN